jgi:hypothetical protein
MIVVTLCLLAVAAPPLAARADDAAPSAADKAAAAAVRAAEAAEKAAEAAARSAAAVEKMAGIAPKPAEAAPAAAAAAAPAGPPAAVWTGVIGVGLISLTGNSQSLTFKASAALQRKSEEWIWGLKAGAVYGQQQIAGSNVSSVSALGASLQLRGDRRFNEMLSVYLIGGIDTDHIASLEERPYGEVGVSLIWFSTKEKIEGSKDSFEKTSLRTDLGFRYGHEWRFQYYPPPVGVSSSLPGVDIIAPHAAAAYRYALNKDIIFTQDLDAVPNLVNEARLLLTSMSKLSSRLTSTVSLGVSFGIAYDSAPATGRKNVDTALTVGLDVAL